MLQRLVVQFHAFLGAWSVGSLDIQPRAFTLQQHLRVAIVVAHTDDRDLFDNFDQLSPIRDLSGRWIDRPERSGSGHVQSEETGIFL